MEKEKELKKSAGVFQVRCSCCRALLWIDPVSRETIKFEKATKKKNSLEELLLKEKKRKKEFDRKFEATAELERERWKKAQEKFEKALKETDKKD